MKNQLTNKRHSREEVIDLFLACAAKNGGKAPGKILFKKLCGITNAEVDYHFWKGGYTELAEEAGLQPNNWQERLGDDLVFEDYAKVCLNIGKIPNDRELRGVQRKLGTKTHTVTTRFNGGIDEFQKRFKNWLESNSDELKAILKFSGWHKPTVQNDPVVPKPINSEPWFYPFLPASLQYLDVLARGECPPFEPSKQPVSLVFERRTADAFRSLGFDVSTLGQGTGRKADAVALAHREHYAIIIDAKVRSNGYVMGTEDRKFLEYSRNHGAELQRQGFEKIYFMVVGSSFKENDLKKLTETLSDSPIRNVVLLTASALMRIVEESIKERNKFSLSELERQFFVSGIISH
jgi:Holliday junction resolvase